MSILYPGPDPDPEQPNPDLDPEIAIPRLKCYKFHGYQFYLISVLSTRSELIV